MARLIAAVVVLLAISPIYSQERTHSQVEAEIAKLEARLATLKAELARFGRKAHSAAAIKEARYVGLDPSRLKVGELGRLDSQISEGKRERNFVEAHYKIVSVIYGEMLVVPTRAALAGAFFVVRQSTDGLAEGRIMRFEGVYEVVETKKYKTRTYYVLEKVAEAK